VSSRFLVRGPGSEGILFETLSRFLAAYIVANRFAHYPVGGTVSLISQLLDATFQFIVKFD
jgi:hypothetical protein